MPLELPAYSGATVSVKAIDAGHIDWMPAELFFSPSGLSAYGSNGWTAPIYAFLIEHNTNKGAGHLERVLFDLGIRKNQDNLPPRVAEVFAAMSEQGPFAMRTDRDVSEKLVDAGVELETIDAVIWSHRHIDHIGDMSTLPSSTDLVVGEGTELRTYPGLETSGIIDSDIAGRKVNVLSFKESKIDIAGLRAVDYFQDGSLYILDTPGHCPGHISALARVTPSTFVMLGGDCCHHPGSIRPTPHHVGYPPSASPMYGLGSGIYEDVELATKTIAKLGELDAHEDVLTLIAHDASLKGVMVELPHNVDSWKENGWKEKVMWAFKKGI